MKILYVCGLAIFNFQKLELMYPEQKQPLTTSTSRPAVIPYLFRLLQCDWTYKTAKIALTKKIAKIS